MRNKKIIKQLNLMLLITLITQFITLVKNSLVAMHFGVGAEIDAFNLTTNLTNLIFSFMGAAVSTVIIPYLKYDRHKKAVSIFISVIYSIAILIVLLLVIFRQDIVYLISGSNQIAYINMASSLLLIAIFTGFSNSVIQLIRSILEFHGQFNRQKITLLLTTLVLVLGLWFKDEMNIYYYSSLVLISSIITLIFHGIYLRKINYTFELNYNVQDINFKEMVRLFIPTILSTGVYQVSILIDTTIASRLGVGNVSILNYSISIINMINLLLLANITSFVYPRLVQKSNPLDRQKSLVIYILFLNIIMFLVISLMFTVGKQGISVLFERGEFTSQNTSIVFICTLIFALSLPSNGIRDLLYRYFYIEKDTITPFVNGVIISVANIVLSLILVNFFQIYGIVIGTVIASFISFLTILVRYNRKFSANKRDFQLLEHFKILLSSVLTIATIKFIERLVDISNTYIYIIFFTILTLLIYCLLLYILKLKLIRSIFKPRNDKN